jgi:pSer/pThr/pTyr-binding forkhead associated (FHA) protein
MQVPARQSPFGASPATAIPASGSRPLTAVPATAVPPAQIPQPVAQPAAIAPPPQVAHAVVPTAQSPHHVSPFSPPAVDTIACPNCGKQVASAFAFCGGCGHRMKGAPGAVAEAAIQRADAVAPAPARVGPRGHLTLIRPDGTEGGVFALQEGENIIGRGHGTLFDADPYLSPKHAEFFLSEAGLEVRDHRSLNGVFVRITEEESLESGDCFRIGQELLRFDAINPLTPLEDGTEIIGTPNPGYWGRLSVVVGRDLDGPAFPLFDETARLGRERGDILFPEDGYVSGAHCQLAVHDGRVHLKDLGSSNGTFLRVRESRVVPSGSLMLMGQQLFRVAYK